MITCGPVAMPLEDNVMVSTDGEQRENKEGEQQKVEEEEISTNEQEALKQQVIDTFTDSAYWVSHSVGYPT